MCSAQPTPDPTAKLEPCRAVEHVFCRDMDAGAIGCYATADLCDRFEQLIAEELHKPPHPCTRR
jgi:hypothetical protein